MSPDIGLNHYLLLGAVLFVCGAVRDSAPGRHPGQDREKGENR